MKDKYIVANWKMNGSFALSESWLEYFLTNYKKDPAINVSCVLCPPLTLIDDISANVLESAFGSVESELSQNDESIDDVQEEKMIELVDNFRFLKVGAQDCHEENSGAYTGSVSAEMLQEIGCEYVIVGHSERRKYQYEANETVAKKLHSVVAKEMTPVLCVGESKEVRDSKKHVDFVVKQLSSCIPKDVEIAKLIVAYEPIWSIGTGAIPTVEEIQEMTNAIKTKLNEDLSSQVKSFSILYGGSVSVNNSAEILSAKNLDGLLVGKASLDAGDFFEIAKQASKA